MADYVPYIYLVCRTLRGLQQSVALSAYNLHENYYSKSVNFKNNFRLKIKKCYESQGSVQLFKCSNSQTLRYIFNPTFNVCIQPNPEIYVFNPILKYLFNPILNTFNLHGTINEKHEAARIWP